MLVIHRFLDLTRPLSTFNIFVILIFMSQIPIIPSWMRRVLYINEGANKLNK